MMIQYTEAGIIALAVRLMETWFLSVGLSPTETFDPADPACVHDYGPHRIFTSSAVIPATRWGYNSEVLRASFETYIYAYNRATEHPEARFGMYSLKFYPGPDDGGTYYASIYQ